MIQSRFQQANTARNMIRQAYREGLTDDDEVVARAIELAGKDAAGMIGRVFTREFVLARAI